jgi:transposase-like protein
VWLSLVERSVRDAEAAGSNPATPTKFPAILGACLVSSLARTERAFYNIRVEKALSTAYCGRCFLDKPVEQFHRRGSGHQRWCKACRKEYDAAYHGHFRELLTAKKRERVEHLVEWMREVKSKPCADCGGRFHPAVMQFDHRPGSPKRDNLSTLVRRSSIRLALDEMANCDIVCANCHAVRTFERRERGRASAKTTPGA